MTTPPGPVLDYSGERGQRRIGRGWWSVAVLLASLPVAAVLSLHLLYAVEWFVNGEPPIPPHHGPDNGVEEVLYAATHILLLLFAFSAVLDAFLPIVAFVKGRSRPPVLLVLPTAAWLASFFVLIVDPWGALYLLKD